MKHIKATAPGWRPAALLLLAGAALAGCDSAESGQAGKTKIVQVVVTAPNTPTPAARAPASAGPQTAPTVSVKFSSEAPYSPPAAPQTLSAAQVQATRQAYEQAIAASDDRLRHGAQYLTPTPTVVYQPPK